MERRKRERRPIAAKVYLSFPGWQAQRCTASNISAGGVFIEAKPFGLLKGTPVELMFVADRGTLIRVHRLSATVVHTSKQGIGMQFYRHVQPLRSAGVSR